MFVTDIKMTFKPVSVLLLALVFCIGVIQEIHGASSAAGAFAMNYDNCLNACRYLLIGSRLSPDDCYNMCRFLQAVSRFLPVVSFLKFKNILNNIFHCLL